MGEGRCSSTNFAPRTYPLTLRERDSEAPSNLRLAQEGVSHSPVGEATVSESMNVQSKSKGFPAGVRSTPVPNQLLAGLLEEIDDLDELKLTLPAVWALHRKRGSPKWVTASEMCGDRTVARALRAAGSELERVVDAKLNAAAERGTLLKVERKGEAGYYLNTEENRRSLARTGALPAEALEQKPEAWPSLEAAEPVEGVFAAYEENIGPLTPVIVAHIQDALLDHTEESVVAAIQAAVDANARSWNYISAVLRRRPYPESGSGEGPDGKPRRDPQKARSDEFIRKYIAKQRARGNR